jgi:aspartyl-tRNA(Asn)/glutamyl-tRNA(Gln) amidotransferase subunit A
VISGYDENDPTSLSEKARMRISAAYQVDHGISERPLRIGVPLDYNITDLDPEIRHTWTRALEALQSQSHVIVPTSLPSTRHALSAYYILAPAEASSNLARYDGVRFGSRAQGSDIQGGTLYSKTRDEGLGAEVKRRILLGSYTLSSEAIHNYFLKAQEIRRLVQNEFDGVFKTKNPLRDQHEAAKDNPEAVDVLLCPTAPNLPPKLSAVETLSPVESYMTDVFTVPASLAGLPAISIPVRAESGLGSVGMQIIGQFGADALVLDVASLFEKSGLIVARSGTASSSQLSTPSAISDKACASESNLTQPGRERRFSEELANAYFNHQRVYGRGIKAVQYYRERGQRSPLR